MGNIFTFWRDMANNFVEGSWKNELESGPIIQGWEKM